ncbi:mucin-5B-like [Ptychodera flava]
MDASNNVKVNGRTAPPTVELVEEDMTVAVDTTRGGYTFININDIITFTWNGGEHAFNAAFDGDNQVRLCGLLGNADGDATNDLIMRNGRITKDVVEFGNSWRVDKLRCD